MTRNSLAHCVVILEFCHPVECIKSIPGAVFTHYTHKEDRPTTICFMLDCFAFSWA